MVGVQKLEVFCKSCGAHTTLCGIGVVEVDLPAQPSAGIGVVEVQKLEVFAILAVPAQPSAGIGGVEAHKLELLFPVFAARG